MDTTLINLLTNLVSNPMSIFLFVSVLLLIIVLVYAQFKKDEFDLKTLIEEEPGKLSTNKIGQLVALWLSSWGFVYLILYKEMTEFYFIGYMGCWASAAVLNNWLTRKIIG